MNLSPGAEAAWMIAAGEAAAGGHDMIEPAHLLIGALSLGKLGSGVTSGELGSNAALVRDENARLLKALSSCGVEATRLRRRARTQLGRGPVQGPPRGPLSRSLTCKAVFAAAADLAGAAQGVGVAHLLAALAEDVDVVTSRIIRAAGAEPARLRGALLEAGKGPEVFGAGPAATALDRAGRDETLEKLRELRPRLERARGVQVADEALATAVDLSVRFEPDRKLPEKAIELVEKAAERASRPTTPSAGAQAEPPLVTPLTIARVLAEKRQLPLDLVTETLDTGMRGRLLALEDYLKERVLGQQEAISRVARRLRLALSAPPARPGPRAVLLFVGPSGVGKTETARLLAEHLFGSASGMIRMDMSELREEESVARLLGPAGGPGAEREGRLTMALRQKPQALLLLDEIEKAHPRVLDVFMKLLDEGKVVDARGRTADARQLVVVMTSNPGAARGGAVPGEEELRKVFGLGLLNRVDEIVYFRNLDPDDVEMIVGRALADLTSAVERRHSVRVRVTPEAARFAAQQAAQAAPGARGAKRTVERLIHGPLGALVLTGKLTRHTSWVAVYDEGGIYLLPEG
jgi:ATP-dependent Clp protease ATP-binding subunit ClpC